MTAKRLPRAQERTLHHIIVVDSPESVLPDVLAIHTIEMIPKSMILIEPRRNQLLLKSGNTVTGVQSNVKKFRVYIRVHF